MRLSGMVVVDKPAGITSHDVVSRCRRQLSERRVGHGGTLDPDATGVLLVGVGRVTRLLRYLVALHKDYTGELALGVATDTLDASGQETGRWRMDVSPDQVRGAASALTGRIMQRPPMVSAVQVGGQRLHQLARAGVEVERPERPVDVTRFEVEPDPADPMRYRFRVSCSSGTYVRVLVDDVGRALGGGAHLVTLRRTAVGPFDLATAVPLDRVTPAVLRPPAEAVGFLPRFELGATAVPGARHGRPVAAAEVGVVPGPDAPSTWAGVDPDGALIGVYELDREGMLRAEVIIQPADGAT